MSSKEQPPAPSFNPGNLLNYSFDFESEFSRVQSESLQDSSVRKNHRKALVRWMAERMGHGKIGEVDPEGNRTGQKLVRLLKENPSEDLRSLYRDLTPVERDRFAQRFGKSQLGLLFSLAEENDSRKFFEGLLTLGGRFKNRNEEYSAQSLYQSLVIQAKFFGVETPRSIQEQANQQLQVLQGQGSFGQTFERFLDHFVEEVSHPGTLIGMGVGHVAFSTARLAGLSWLTRRPAGILTRGFASRALASTAAFPVEVLAFWETNRIYGQMFTPELVSYDRETMLHEIQGLGLMLGMLKFFGSVSRGVLDHKLGFDALTQKTSELSTRARMARWVIPQVGMYAGIVSGNYLGGKWGFHPEESTTALFANALGTLLHFNVMGFLSKQALGTKFAEFQKKVELANRRMDRGNPPPGRSPWFDSILPSLKEILPSPLAVTPEGIRIPVSERDSPSTTPPHIVKMAEEGRPPFKIEFVPGFGSAGETPTEALRSMIDGYLDGKDPGWKIRVGAELFSHLETVEGLVREKFEVWGLPEEINKTGRPDLKDPDRGEKIDKEVGITLESIRIDHLTMISDQLFGEAQKYSFLVEGLRLREQVGTRQERDAINSLLGRTSLKQIELFTHHGEAENLIADYRPLRSEHFSLENYSHVSERFQGYLKRAEDYIERHEVLKEIAAGWHGKPTPRYERSRSEEEIGGLLRQIGIAPEVVGLLRQAIRYDAYLNQKGLVPLYKVLENLNEGTDSDFYLALWDPIEVHVQALRSLWKWTDPETVSRFSQAVKGDPKSFSESREEFEREIREKMVLETDQLRELGEALQHYFETGKALHEILKPYQPREREVEPVTWERAREIFEGFRSRGDVKEETYQVLMKWLGAPESSLRNRTLLGMRSEVLTGLMEVTFGERRTPEETQRLSRFIEQICEREDHGMMINLAIHLNYYRHGDVGPASTTRRSRDTDRNGHDSLLDRQESFVKALLETADFYNRYPRFKGAYFGIQEILSSGRRDIDAQLAAPLDQLTRKILDEEFNVELLERGSLGTAALRVRREGHRERTVAMTSIQEKVKSREQVFYWLDRMMDRLGYPLGQPESLGPQLPLGVTVHLPRFHSTTSLEDVKVWARDYMNSRPGIVDIRLFVPAERRNVDDPFDPNMFKREIITRDSPSTLDLIDQMESQLTQDMANLPLYLRLYRHYGDLDPVHSTDSRAFSILQLANHRFPLNRAVRAEMGRALRKIYPALKNSRETLLSDFSEDDTVQNRAWARQRMMEAEGEVPSSPNGHRRSLYSGIQSSLGGPDHYGRVANFMEGALGIRVSANRLLNLFDLGPAGFNTKNIYWNYREPGTIGIRGDIHSSRYESVRPERNLLQDIGKFRHPSVSEGHFSITLSRDPVTSRVRIELSTFTLPEFWQKDGAYTQMIDQLIRLGRELKVNEIYFSDVQGPGRVAILKAGGQITNQHFWNVTRDGFLPFLESYMTERGIKEYDIGDVFNIYFGYELAHAHLSPQEKRLNLHPWQLQTAEEGVTVYLDPAHKVGQEYLLLDRGPHWEVKMDLSADSPGLEHFREYYMTKFGKEPWFVQGE